MGLRPAEFWALSARQFHAYQVEYDRKQRADAEVLRVLIGRAATLIVSPYCKDDPITLDDYCPPFTEDDPAPAASQEEAQEALRRLNGSRFDVLLKYAEFTNGKQRSESGHWV